MKILRISALLALVSFSIAGTLEDVQSRGYVKCGVTTGLLGFAAPDDSGKWSGFDVDVCRAVAAAVLGDSSKVEFTTTTGKTRFPTLASGEIDVLARNTTWTFSRDVNLGFEFVGVNYYDGQGFLVPASLGKPMHNYASHCADAFRTGVVGEGVEVSNWEQSIPVETNYIV